MNPLALYWITVALGDIAYWRCGLLYPWIHHNGFTKRWETPDPADCPAFLAYMMSPIPGLAALVNFLLAVGRMSKRSWDYETRAACKGGQERLNRRA